MTQRSINDWIMLLNTEMSKLYNLKKPIPIIEHDYGYASYKSILIAILNMISFKDVKEIETFVPAARVTVGRELTKVHEEIVQGTAREVAARLQKQRAVRGEFVVIIQNC